MPMIDHLTWYGMGATSSASPDRLTYQLDDVVLIDVLKRHLPARCELYRHHPKKHFNRLVKKLRAAFGWKQAPAIIAYRKLEREGYFKATIQVSISVPDVSHLIQMPIQSEGK